MDEHLAASGGREQDTADLLLFFIAAVVLRQRRRLIDECRDQVSPAASLPTPPFMQSLQNATKKQKPRLSSASTLLEMHRD